VSIYLDNAATSHPKPEEVYRAVDHALRDVSANPGRSGHRTAIEANRVIFEARETIASLFGIRHPDRIIFTPNATAALNLAIKGLLRPGEHCVTSGMEHNSVTRPLKFLSQLGVEVDKVRPSPEGVLEPGMVRASVKKNTKLIAVTHASNVIGTITQAKELAGIAHDAGAVFMLDAAQTAGSVAIDVEAMGIDLLACPGHKGLYGPQGTGFLYISDRVNLKPLIFGGTGSRSDVELMPDFLPDRYEAGTLNTPGIAGLAAGVEFILAEGVGHIRAHEVSLCGALIEGLSAIGGVRIYGLRDPEKRASVVTFNLSGADPAALGDRLDSEYAIAVRVGIHCAPDAHKAMGSFPGGAVRMSPGYFNTAEEIDIAVDAVGRIARDMAKK
jgi:cysteine desulfurase/selenocysteine lyase